MKVENKNTEDAKFSQLLKMSTKNSLKEAKKAQNMVQDAAAKAKLSEEAQKDWEQVEKLYRKACKLNNNAAERAFAESCFEFLSTFFDKDENEYVAVELSQAQLKTLKKLFKEYDKVTDKVAPQLSSNGETIYYPEM